MIFLKNIISKNFIQPTRVSYVSSDVFSVFHTRFFVLEQNAKAEGVSNTSFGKGDAAHLEFPEEIFDTVTGNYVYHNIPSGDKVTADDGQKYIFLRFSGMERNIISTAVFAGVILSFSSHSRVMPSVP